MLNDFNSLNELIAEANKRNISLSALTLSLQAEAMKTTEEDIRRRMEERLSDMRESVRAGMEEVSSPSGLSGGMAKKLYKCNINILGKTAKKAAAYALAVAEHNACMGRIVAAPTAGSCGILPGVLFALEEEEGLPREKLIDGLLNAGAVGMVTANNATLAGSAGGCASECGSAGAMAASATTELLGGTPDMCAHACAIAFKAIMGLVCDPVAGLVEVPCVKRNATGAVIALTAAQLALSGIKSAISTDDTIIAMKNVGNMMNEALRETSRGGVAATESAKRIKENLKKGDKGC